MNSQSQSGQSGQNLNYDHTQFDKWIDGVTDPTQLQQVLTKVVGKISAMPTSQKDQIVSNLRNDARFSEFAERFAPQTA